jgi:cyanophycinase
MVIGGAINDTSPIFQRTVDEGGGKDNVHILVATAASLTSAASFAYYQDVFHRLNGVSLDNIRQLRIADRDDPESKFVDESTWKDNADKDAEVASVRDWATVLWFAGGDQAHIASTFMNPDGTDRKVTTATRQKLATGKLIVAGTSAGAAIMTDPMIGEGDPLKSWLYPPVYAMFYPSVEPDGGFNPENAVLLNKGLGFLTAKSHVLVDTHWFQRARFPRTIRAIDFASGAGKLDPALKVGLGLGENTGLLVDLADGTAEVVGDVDASWVGVVDLNEATTNGSSNPYSGENVRVGYLGVRDRFALPSAANPSGVFLPEASKHRYLPCNGNRDPAPLAGDMLVPGAYIDVLQNLLDGTRDDAGAGCHAEGFVMRLSPGSKSTGGGPFAIGGFFFRFTTDAKTKEYWSRAWGWEIENALMRWGSGTGTYSPPF